VRAPWLAGRATLRSNQSKTSAVMLTDHRAPVHTADRSAAGPPHGRAVCECGSKTVPLRTF